MTELDDIALLHEYVGGSSDEAFATLVSRHVNKVYSAALRHTGNPHQAEEITQAVFVILASKARHMGSGVILSGWLYQTARLTALTFVRSEIRRARREQEAHMQNLLNENAPDLWPQIAPLLDAAMADLNETDRNAVVLRYFDGKSMKEVGEALGATEEATKKRLSRAVDKLQKFFSKRGVTSTAQTITGSISTHSVQAAPLALAKTATAIALAKGATASASTSTLIKGALKIMAWSKAKTAIYIAAAALATAGTATMAFNTWFFKPSVEDVFKHYDDGAYLNHAPPVELLRPTQYANQGSWVEGSDHRILGRNRSLAWVLAAAYDIGSEQIILPPDGPRGGFDYLITSAANPTVALQEQIKKKLGLITHTEMRTTNVLVLKVSKPGMPGLKLNSHTGDGSILVGDDKATLRDFSMSAWAVALGGYFVNTLVVDGTGLTNDYDFILRWKRDMPDVDGMNQLLQSELGLELVPDQRSVEMLVVDYANGPSDFTPRAGSDLQGYWTGSEEMGPHAWPIRLKITEPTNGQFRAMWRRPWLNSQFVLASAVTYNPPKIRVEVDALPGFLEGEINAAHDEITGTWTYKTNTTHPVTLRLTNPKDEREQQAALDAQKNFTTTGPDDLAGHWKIPDNSDFSLDISRVSGGKFFASIIRPGWEGTIDATMVQFTPLAVHIEWAWRGLDTFDGKIQDGKLTGTWRQGRKGTPELITFVRE